jgi:addiction module RelB/DinJ family antitoxin
MESLTIDKDLKEKAAKVLRKYNLSLNEGISIFLKRVVKEKKLSFEPEPTDELAQAVEESMKGKVVHFRDSKELLKTIRK